MAPQTTETKLPTGYTLAQRPTREPRADERPTLRDERGRVMALVERWALEAVN